MQNPFINTIVDDMKQKRVPKESWTIKAIQEAAKNYSTRTEFANGNREAYLKAQREGWLDEICGFMVGTTKPKGYWTKERLLELAKEYKSRADFNKGEPCAYRIAHYRGWIDDLNQCFEKRHQQYTKEECRLEASKYQKKKDFERDSPQYYNYAKEHRFLTEICSHMGTIGKFRYVYVVEFVDHHAYIGLSYSPQRRFKQHLNEEKSTVFKYIKETGCKYIFKILSSTLAEKAVKQEILWMRKYKEEGWVLLNRELDEFANDGSPKYTYEYCEMIANRYAHSQNFQKGNSRVYNYAARCDWLDNICQHMDRDSPKAQQWTKEKCQGEAYKYKTRKDFQKGCRGAYAAAYRKKWLEEICSHMERPTPHNLYWTLERCQEEANKYATLSDFINGSESAYNAAKRKGWLEIVCVHTKRVNKPAGYWTKGQCIKEAKKNNTMSEFRKNCPSAYVIALRNGWLDDIRDFLKKL